MTINLIVKKISEYLSGDHDEELNVLVAEVLKREPKWIGAVAGNRWLEPMPKFSISLDACCELLVDLTVEELCKVVTQISLWDMEVSSAVAVLRMTARKLCIAYLIIKGVIPNES